jgi:hypothetical protein
MVMAKTFECDLCDTEVGSHNMVGWDQKNIVGPYMTEDKHICNKCLSKLKAELLRKEKPVA